MSRNWEQCRKTSCRQQEPVCLTAQSSQLSHSKMKARREDHFPQLLDEVPEGSYSASWVTRNIVTPHPCNHITSVFY